MVVKKIKYTDFKGNEREEEFMFHLTPAEIMEMELGTSGGFAESLQKIISSQDAPKIMEEFKKLILKSYGEVSADGKMFVKDEQLSKNFSYTNAYSKLFMELSTDDEAAAAFIKGIVPEEMADDVDEAVLAPVTN
mgnify:CR=1 FL=1